MYEVELKAKISGRVAGIVSQLDRLSANPRVEQTYQDLYLDAKDRVFARSGKELRIRTIITKSDNRAKTVLTYKEPPFDVSTDSKPEFEITVSDGAVLEYILGALGYQEDIRFAKHCLNYELPFSSYEVAATVVTLDEIQDAYIELEIQVPDLEQTDAAKSALYSLLKELGIPTSDLTTDGYMDMVRRVRERR